MNQFDCRKGMVVVFGKPGGEKTLGKVVKPNAKSCKIETLESRGRSDKPAGRIWNVAWLYVRPATEVEKAGGIGGIGPQPAPVPIPVVTKPLEFNPFDEDNGIIEEILNCYCGLSPENLCCDGEASPSWVRQQSTILHRKLKHLQAAIDRTVSEDEAIAWSEQKREWQKRNAG